jgi:Flp pilus assembly protein TadG
MVSKNKMECIMKRPISPRRRKRQRGNVLIEFALSSTLLLTIAIGITGFARIFNLANMAAGAASAGIQYGGLSPSNYLDLAGMQNAAVNDTGNYPGATAVATQFCTCTVGGTQGTCPASCGGSLGQTYIQVSVTIPYTSVISFPTIPNPLNITQVSCARVQ